MIYNEAMKLISFIISAALMTSIAHSQETPIPEKSPASTTLYQKCLDKADRFPLEALGDAQLWLIDGGAAGARHCIATALFNLNKFEKAGKAFEDLSEEVQIGFFGKGFSKKYLKHLKGELLFQAGVSWSEANNLGKAYILLTSALNETPEDSELTRRIYVERGLVAESRRKYNEALKDFTAAIEMDAGIAETYIYRAHIFRLKKSYGFAREDIDRALYILPDNVNALLESGIIYRLVDYPKKARAAWEKIIKLNHDSVMTKLALENIKLLSVKP